MIGSDDPSTGSSAWPPLIWTIVLASIASAWILTRPAPFALTSDAETLQHPLLVDAFRQLCAGRLPIWTTGRWGGSPLLGDPVVGALYLPYYLGYLLTPFPHARALDVSTCLHLVLLATGMVCLFRRLGADAVTSVAAAVLAGTVPEFLLVARGWQQYWAALSWWPWLFWAAVSSVGGTTRVAPLVGAIALAAQVYAGYPEFALYSGIPALLWIVLASGPRRLRRAIVAGLIGLGAVALASPQVLPGLDMARESIRFGPGATETMALLDRVAVLPPRSWLEAMLPTPMRLTWPKVAPPVVVLAVVGAFRGGIASRLLATMALVDAFLATGPNPVFGLLKHVPPFSLFGGPSKLMFPAAFAVVTLAGLGLVRLPELSAGRRRAIVGAVAVGLVLCGTGSVVARVALIVAAVAAVAVPSAWLAPAAAGLVVAGSVLFLPATRALDTPLQFMPPEFMPLLRRSPDVRPAPTERMLALLESRVLYQVGLNFGSLWGIGAWNGMADLAQWRQLKVMERAEPGAAPALIRQIGAAPVVVGAGTPLAEQLSAAGFTTVDRQADLLFLQPPWPMPPHAVLMSQARAAPAMEAIATARTGNALDDGHVLIEADVLPGGVSGDATAALVDLEVDAGVVRARANVTRPTWLVVREPYYPNWEATIDGRPTRIYPAAGFLLAVLLDAGAHEVRIAYHEPHLALGVMLAVAAIVLLPIAFRHVLRPS